MSGEQKNNNQQEDIQEENIETQTTEENNIDGQKSPITYEQVQALGLEIKKLREENEVLKDSIVREKAENENLRKRHMRELDDTSKYIVGEFAKELTEVMENLYRAQSYQSDFDSLADSQEISPDEIKGYATKVNSMFEGIDMTLKSLEKAFSKYGVNRIHPEGEEFDHKFHQAISQSAVDNVPHNNVVQVIQAGYAIKDRLLKPALVVVNNNPNKKENGE